MWIAIAKQEKKDEYILRKKRKSKDVESSWEDKKKQPARTVHVAAGDNSTEKLVASVTTSTKHKNAMNRMRQPKNRETKNNQKENKNKK